MDQGSVCGLQIRDAAECNSALPGRDARGLDLEGMPPVQVGGLRLAPERLGDLLAGPDELSLRRGPRLLGQIVRADLLYTLKDPDSTARRVGYKGGAGARWPGPLPRTIRPLQVSV